MTALDLARELHRTQPVVVGHVDLPAELHLRRQFGDAGALARDYLPRCRAAGLRVLVGSIFVHPAYLPDMALSMALEQTAALLTEIDRSDGAFCLVRSRAQLNRTLDRGQIAIVLSMEGCEPLGRSPALLRAFFDLGVRLLGLTWNGRTAAADGCLVPQGGLTDMGRELAREAWRLGMALDVSHLNDPGFSDLLALEGGPVLASHSNCRALCPHPRNLTDRQLQQLGRRGGVIGVNQVRFLVRRDGAGLDDLCGHIRRIERLAGPGRAALGLDLARHYMDALPKPRAFWQTWRPEDEDLLSGYEDLPLLTERLLESGMEEEAIRGVLGGNLLRFLRNALPEA